MCCLISDKNSAEPKAMPSADNGCHVGLAICIDKLTKRLNLTKENISNCINTYVVIKISLGVILELNDNLIGRRIKQDVTNDGRVESVRLEEHDRLGRKKVCECETC
jgi:hypothetical protein